MKGATNTSETGTVSYSLNTEAACLEPASVSRRKIVVFYVASAGSLLLESKWQQSCSDHCSGPYGHHSSSVFQFRLSLFQAFGNSSKQANYYWYYLHVPQLFQLLCKIQILVYLFAFFHFYSKTVGIVKSTRYQKLIFFFDFFFFLSLGLTFWSELNL